LIRIFIIDDHAIVRQGLKQIVAGTHDILVSEEASDGLEALNKLQNDNYDLVLLDISIPGIHGLDLLARLKSNRPEIPVLILSIHPEQQYAARAFRCGASGYLMKDSAPDELVTAIRRVAMGRKYISTTFAEQLAMLFDTDIDKPSHETLSDREYEVLINIALGKTPKEIAHELSLSVKTVSTYRCRILRKMRMTANAQLIRYALENQLLQ
jgi:DNA-binding NarL/FixJ family response regulator